MIRTRGREVKKSKDLRSFRVRGSEELWDDKKRRRSIEEGAGRNHAEPWPHLHQKWIVHTVNSTLLKSEKCEDCSATATAGEQCRDRGGDAEDPNLYFSKIILFSLFYYFETLFLVWFLSFIILWFIRFISINRLANTSFRGRFSLSLYPCFSFSQTLMEN